jgi:hypothetical protein
MGWISQRYLLTLMSHETTLCSMMDGTRWKLAAAAVAVVSLAVTASPVSADDQRGRERGTTTTSDPSTGWDMALTAGFVISGLTDPVYALGNVAGQPTRVVVRETAQESSASVGVAMFGQVYHDRHSWIAPLSFGIGIRGDSRATFYLGSALRFGSHASFTGGVAVGPIAALPAGVVEGRAVTDTNFLSNLGTRTTVSWFTGVTYTFASLR